MEWHMCWSLDDSFSSHHFQLQQTFTITIAPALHSHLPQLTPMSGNIFSTVVIVVALTPLTKSMWVVSIYVILNRTCKPIQHHVYKITSFQVLTVLSRSLPWISWQSSASLLNIPDCGFDTPANKFMEFILDCNLDLTNWVSAFRLCFELCSQVVGVLGFWAPMLSSMHACWPVWAWRNSIFFQWFDGE